MELSQADLDLLAVNNVSVEELNEFIRTSGEQSVESAIGGIMMLRNGQGQERNESFQTQAEADAQVSAEAPVVEVSEVEGAPVVEVVAEEVKSESVEEGM